MSRSCKICFTSKELIWDDVSPARAAASDPADLLRRRGRAGLARAPLGDCAKVIRTSESLRCSGVEYRYAVRQRGSRFRAHRSHREFIQEALVLPVPLPDW